MLFRSAPTGFGRQRYFVGADALIRPSVQAAATAWAARSEAERAEREAGQMRSCTPTQDAPSATGQQLQESQKIIACPKASPNRSRHLYADPRRAEGHCTGARLSGLFFWTVHGPFSFRPRPKRKWGVHPRWTSPLREQNPPRPPSGGPYRSRQTSSSSDRP